MDTTYLKKARRLWSVDYMPYWHQRENMRKWVRAVRALGDHSLLAKQVKRV